MNLIGPKSLASKLHLMVKIVFFLAVARVLVMAIAPVFPNSSLQYLSFVLRSGPLYADFPLLRGAEARWWIWAMELVSRICHAAILYLLMRILAPVGAGELFHANTPARLRMMGCIVVIGSLLRTFFCAVLLNGRMTPESGASISWAFDADAIFIGIVLVILAEVFRSGHVLRTESELTV
jgi:hypothetical protein